MTNINPFSSDTWGPEERAYFEGVDSALRVKSRVPFGNGKPAHAAYLIDKFFAKAANHVRLFSGCLTQEAQGIALYGNPHIHRTVEGFLQRGGKLSIMLEDTIDAPNKDALQHPLIKAALAVRSDAMQLRQAAKVSIDGLKSADYHYHWMVMDKRAFRLETNIEQYKAAVCFGRADVAVALASLFDKMFEKAEQLI